MNLSKYLKRTHRLLTKVTKADKYPRKGRDLGRARFHRIFRAFDDIRRHLMSRDIEGTPRQDFFTIDEIYNIYLAT